ncbi:MAG TPA: hypothetical protein VFU07_09460 [Candidatus Lumbricidophila sp.]|nr:hypothetical protein [Candidatus Lumbricidophila sp.]
MTIDPEKFRLTADTTISDIDLEVEEYKLVDGARLTETRAAEMAAAAIARRRANLVPGRKSLSGDGAHSPVVQFRTPRRPDAEALAAELGISVSELARRALDGVLDAHPTTKRFHISVS